MIMRKPVAAGTFYPSDEKELLEEITYSFTSKFGFGSLDSYGKAVGAIVPHAGYVYSGPCASHAYSSLKKDINTVVIFGTNHTGLGESIALSDEVWMTPLGKVKPDTSFIEGLKEEGFKVDNTAHKFEHSIEVQLPFLQFKYKNFLIVPICVSHRASLNEVKKLAKAVIKLSNSRTIYLASSDFTHYGYNYGFLPFVGSREEVRTQLYNLDKRAIFAIENLDTKTFLNIANQTTICGTNAIVTMIELAKIKKLKPRLLQYYTSGDLLGDYSNAVGYAAIVFE